MKKSLLVALLSISAAGCFGQFYTAGTPYTNHHDVPDTLLYYTVTPHTHKTYSVDMFGSSAPDLVFTIHGHVSSGGSGQYIHVTAIHPSVSVRFSHYDSTWIPADQKYYITRVAEALEHGDTINSLNAVWQRDTLYLSDHSGFGGGQKNVNEFVGGEKFLGVRYEAEEYDDLVRQYYGWIRINCISQDSCYVKEYSALRVVTSAEGWLKDKVRVFPNPAGDLIFVDVPDVTDFKCRLTDITGNEVSAPRVTCQGGIGLDLSGLPPGIYLLSGELEGQKTTVRLVKGAD